MNVLTDRFGEVAINDKKIITFLGGIVGFENYYRYAVLDYIKNSQFKWLQCINDPSLAFVICDPWYFFKDYEIEINDENQKELEIKDIDDITVLSIATIPSDISKTSLNLISPIIINVKKMIGKQVILYGSGYSTKHQIILKINTIDKEFKKKITLELKKEILKDKVLSNT